MNMAETFARARPLAQHCAELTMRGPRPEERADHLSAWRRDVARELTDELAPLFSGGRFRASMNEPQLLEGAQVFERIGPIAANSLLRCGEHEQTLLFSIDLATAIALTDCSFGGEGKFPDDPPAQLPRSASLLVEKVAGIVAQSIATVAYAGEARGDIIVRSESAARLKPFGPETPCALFTLIFEVGQQARWETRLAVSSERLDSLLPGLGTARPSRRRGHVAADGTAAPFADLPLSLEAVLGEFEMSLSRLERLSPGDQIPLTIPRELPLRIGSKTFAHGTLGTLEDRMAIRLTRLPQIPQQGGTA
jgi:flagellar motor switch/type III secretory pathway protein FliN